MPSDILKELWRGNIRPFEATYQISKELLIKYEFVENTLRETLSKEQQELFEKYQSINDTISNECECASFENGFCLGAKMMLQIVSSSKK